jgi:transcriptional regulator with XRE-family HTH domain
MDIRVRIGKRIKELRLALRLTQEALADKVDLDTTYINEVENGKKFKHEQIVFKPELVIRASTQALRN